MNGPVEEPEGAAGTDHAAGFIEGLAPSVANQKMALAALRQFFDLLVTRHGALLNPFHSVRGPPMGSSDGKTPEITASQARRLLASIDCSRPVGLRDRAVIGTLHLHRRARRGGGQVPIPGPPRLRRIPDPPLPGKAREGAGDPAALGLGPLDRRVLRASPDPHHPKEVPLFRPVPARDRSRFAVRQIGTWTIRQLLKRRLKDAVLPHIITPHSFRAMVVTDLLSQGVPIEDVQYLVGHSHPSTTQIYDRRSRKVTRNIVERISV